MKRAILTLLLLTLAASVAGTPGATPSEAPENRMGEAAGLTLAGAGGPAQGLRGAPRGQATTGYALGFASEPVDAEHSSGAPLPAVQGASYQPMTLVCAVPSVCQSNRQGNGVGVRSSGLASMPALSGEASSFVVASAIRHGTLSYVGPKYGSRYLALPEPRGTVATICGPADCVTRRSTDYGPDQRVHPDRIADLSAADFVRVCGVPLSAGLCKGTVELEPPVDPADDAARVEDGGPRPTVPPTDVAP